MDLEKASFKFKPRKDRRPRMEEPPPVEIEAVEDLHLQRPACTAEELAELYVEVLRFLPQRKGRTPAFRAANFMIRFDLERQEQRDYRPVRVLVTSLNSTEAQLAEREMVYTRTKGIMPGTEVLVLQDADGNWVEVRGHRQLG